MIYRLITEDSVEEKIQELQTKKNDLSNQILDGHEVPVDLTPELIRQLILD